MYTAAYLNTYTLKDLAQIAKKKGIVGWHSMRKEQLVRALVKEGKTSSKAKSTTPRGSRGRAKPAATKKPRCGAKPARRKIATDPKALRKIQRVNAAREREKDMATRLVMGNGKSRPADKDRLVLMVRDPYWLHAHWELTERAVRRSKAALAEHWHTARPMLRLIEVPRSNATATSERVLREIEIHGGVKDWYIDVRQPPQTYRVEIGYMTSAGRFYAVARSNCVTTPRPGSREMIDSNWADVVANSDRIYAMSGGYDDGSSSGVLQEMFEERLQRPMGSPAQTRFGAGADPLSGRDFEFTLDAEMIVYGMAEPGAYVAIAGEPVNLRPDGSFSTRVSLPERRQVLPVVASSADGIQERTIVLAIERNTKVMETKVRDVTS